MPRKSQPLDLHQASFSLNASIPPDHIHSPVSPENYLSIYQSGCNIEAFTGPDVKCCSEFYEKCGARGILGRA